MQNYGLVSIITPSWNCGCFIRDTIDSVIHQTYQNWELLIQDDCSTDNTKEVVEYWIKKEPRIKYDCNEHNSGAAITRNSALRRARGKWIAFLDSDDLWLPNKLECQLRFMIAHDYSFSYHEYSEIDENGKNLGVYVSGINRVNQFNMFACCWPGCLSVMYNYEKIGLIQIQDLPKNNDTAMWFQIVRMSPCYLLKENLACYRKRNNSITPKPLYKRLYACYQLFRIGEIMCPAMAVFWTIVNIFGNTVKKTFYVKHF